MKIASSVALTTDLHLTSKRGDKHAYELYAVINHHGKRLESGHFSAQVRHLGGGSRGEAKLCESSSKPSSSKGGNQNNKKARERTGSRLRSGAELLSREWYTCDDETVTQLPELSLESDTVYVLFYHQRKK